MNNTLIVILGPTGVGKTDVSIELAKHLCTEIISCDSRQFYNEMQIGTAVPSDVQLREVKHHFIRFISVTDYYSASLFERDVLNIINSIFLKNRNLIMTGGSGLYIDIVCNGIDDIPDTDPQIREDYINKYINEGIESLREELRLADPVHYNKVDLNNYKRIIRALEISKTTGLPYSSFLKREKNLRDFRIVKIGLNIPRNELYERIDKRVDRMLTDGLEKEARALYGYKNYNALNTVGYKEFFSYFDGEITYEETIRLIKRNTRRYAKRQLTWWAKDNEIKWFDPSDAEGIRTYISSLETKLNSDCSFK